jgi:hypothetical protein
MRFASIAIPRDPLRRGSWPPIAQFGPELRGVADRRAASMAEESCGVGSFG